MRKDILIPHLGFLVSVRPVPKGHNAYASTFIYKDKCKVVLPKGCPASAVAHELVHVLQELCKQRAIDFNEEGEHMGYIMQWLMETIMRGRWTLK
jgi:hypothetical protein